MFAPTTRILALAAISMVAKAWAQPPAATQDNPGANPQANSSPQSVNIGKLALLAQTQPPASGGMPGIAASGPSGTPATSLELNAPPPNTRNLIETPASEKFTGEVPGTPIPKMPAFTVVGAHVFGFRERDLYTKDGMAALSFKRHPGLYVGDAFNLNANAAHEMFLADDWRSTKKDYWDMAHAMAIGGDASEGRMILQAVKDEDMEMRAEGDNNSGVPAFDRTQVGHIDGDSKLLQAPEDPIDIPFVRVKW
jgi:hypothetical protein